MAEGPRQRDPREAAPTKDYVVLRRDRWFRENGTLQVLGHTLPIDTFLLWREVRGHKLPSLEVFVRATDGTYQSTEDQRRENLIRIARSN